MLIKFATIMVLGPPVVAVVIFEVVLNASAMFNHGNIYLPEKLTGSCGFCWSHGHAPGAPFGSCTAHQPIFGFACGDRLFGTHVAQPPEGHTGIQIVREFS